METIVNKHFGLHWLFSTQPETFTELCEIYKSPQHVQRRLFDTLYPDGMPQSVTESFNKYSMKVGGTSYWSASSCTNFIAHSYPHMQDIVKDAAPIIFRIILHHGTYPFKPEQTVYLSVENLAIAVSLLTAADRGKINMEERGLEHSVYYRPRRWIDRCRLLFQSLCDTDWTAESLKTSRTDEDDADLMAVMDECMSKQTKWDRNRFRPVAATLSSSYSGRLVGRVSVAEMKILLESLLVASAGDSHDSFTANESGLKDAVLALLNSLSDQEEYLDSESFSVALSRSIPLLLTELATFITSLIPMESPTEGPFPINYSWNPPFALTAISLQRKQSFLTVSQFSQLGLAIRRPILDKLTLIRQGTPEDSARLEILGLISKISSARLLAIRGICLEEPFVLACYLPSNNSPEWDRWLKKDGFWLPGIDAACFVQILPIHNVLKGRFAKALVYNEATGAMSIHLGGASLWFDRGPKNAKLSGGAEPLEITVEKMELWGRGA